MTVQGSGATIEVYCRKDGKWSWRLIIRGENECGDNSSGFATRELAASHATKCLSYMVYNLTERNRS